MRASFLFIAYSFYLLGISNEHLVGWRTALFLPDVMLIALFYSLGFPDF